MDRDNFAPFLAILLDFAVCRCVSEVKSEGLTPELSKYFERTVTAQLSSEMQIVDGMDTIVATLNWLRLAIMSDVTKVSARALPVGKLMDGLSAQIDAELALLNHPQGEDGQKGLVHAHTDIDITRGIF